MYLDPKAAELLRTLDIDPQRVTDDPTGTVLAQVANSYARHQAAMAAAAQMLIDSLEQVAAGGRLVGPLSSSTEVNRHDEAYHGLNALNSSLNAARAAWQRAHSQDTGTEVQR